jgi:hypothetical protein
VAAKGYCVADDVADFLAQTFTAGQEAQCNELIERAELHIDNETNRGWLMGAQTEEAFYNPGNELHLRYTPVTSVDAITGRTALGESETALTVDEDYEVRDLEKGLIYIVSPGSYDRLLVDYTPSTSVPPDLKQACVEIVANWMQPHLQPGSYGLDSYSLPDLTVRFSRSHVQASVPPNAQRVIDHYRYRIHA